MTIDEGQGAVITGGAGDIGRAIALELMHRGARITLIDQKPAPDVADALAGLGEVTYLAVDVRDHHAVTEALTAIDPLDVVIGNAGVVASAPFLEITPEQWGLQLDVNLTGCFNVGQAAARLMVERNRPGRIVFTSSWVQDVPWPEICAYAVSKAGLKMLTRCMAAELAPHGILVNAVAPGIVAAGMARRQMETEPQYAARATRAVPLGRFQQPAEVARVVAVLCSDAGNYMTGSVLLADGGCSLQMIVEDERPSDREVTTGTPA
jgi:NAD(P)-dependent dehydrogenase (short-subunit alcohol dehydrogenase family)